MDLLVTSVFFGVVLVLGRLVGRHSDIMVETSTMIATILQIQRLNSIVVLSALVDARYRFERSYYSFRTIGPRTNDPQYK